MFILAASSLHHATKTLPPALLDHNKKGIYALPGLSFNPNEVKLRKTAQFQLNLFFRDKKRLVIWHDVVNNSLSRHCKNNKKPLTPSQLFAALEKYQEHIEAKVYCPREGTLDIYNQLKRSTLVTIGLVKDIVSRRKKKDPSLLKEYRAFYQKLALELKTLTIVLEHKNNLRSLITSSRPKKLSKRRRKTLRTRHAFEEAELTQAFDNLIVTQSCVVVGVYPLIGGVS